MELNGRAKCEYGYKTFGDNAQPRARRGASPIHMSEPRTHRAKTRLSHRVAPSPPPSLAIAHAGEHARQTSFFYSSLLRALPTDERQDLAVRTMHGRSTALRLAREEAVQQGSAWTMADARRFKYLPEAPPSAFADDSLREMLDQALVGAYRRGDEALAEAAQARAHSLAADHDSIARLEEAARQFKDPNAEKAVRQAAKALQMRAEKEYGRLRAALEKVEGVLTDTQQIHAADMRSLGARLVAQRNAVAECVLNELRHADNTQLDGAHSIASLQAELHRVREDRRRGFEERDAEIARLSSDLDAANGRLEGANVEIAQLRSNLDAANERLKGEESERMRGRAELALLTSELSSEEDGRAADAEAYEQLLEQEAAAMMAAWEAERNAHEDHMNERLQTHGLEVEERAKVLEKAATIEVSLLDQLRRLTAAKANERRRLQGRIDLLNDQVAALRASKSIKRSYLYWTGMKAPPSARAKAKQVQVGSPHELPHGSLDSISLADPSVYAWRKPRLPREVAPESHDFNRHDVRRWRGVLR